MDIGSLPVDGIPPIPLPITIWQTDGPTNHELWHSSVFPIRVTKANVTNIIQSHINEPNRYRRMRGFRAV